MTAPNRPCRALRDARSWILLGILAPIGMLAVSGFMLADLRRDAWDKAEQTSVNLLQVIERDIARNVEIIDLSVQAVAENLRTPGLDELTPAVRQLVLFDRAATARDLGVILALDERGDITHDSRSLPARTGNYADRDYFQVHRRQAGLGLYVSRPLVSRLTGEWMINFSRRIDKPDGSFGGVVLGTLKLSYFKALFDRIGLGEDGAINLYLRDGTRVMRHPGTEADIGANISGAPTFRRFVGEARGSFVGTSVRDGVERYYAFTRVGDLPLVLNVALSVREIEAEWRSKALAITAIVTALCGLTIALSLLFARELRRRSAMEAELARLSSTDGLTGLGNRRLFDGALTEAFAEAEGSGRPMSLLIVDADHFKRYNDRHGHAVGDLVLKGLARSLASCVHRPGDRVFRVGGEEFAVLLRDTDRAGALRVADKVHAAVSGLSVGSHGIRAGTVTVSIGLALASGRHGSESDLYQAADAALYAAKAAGRNRTCCEPQGGPGETLGLRIVGA